MIRCGQMLIAEALKRIHLSREWLWTRETKDEMYLMILNRFEDCKTSPYGIHQIAQLGLDSGKKVGEWFSPNEISQILK
jgi:cysteine protease ATG4